MEGCSRSCPNYNKKPENTMQEVSLLINGKGWEITDIYFTKGNVYIQVFDSITKECHQFDWEFGTPHQEVLTYVESFFQTKKEIEDDGSYICPECGFSFYGKNLLEDVYTNINGIPYCKKCRYPVISRIRKLMEKNWKE